MLLDQGLEMMERITKEIREADPQKRDHLTNIFIEMLDAATEMLKDSPEFREAFARVHGEFLNYPECRLVFEQGVKAYNQYYQD